MSVTEDSKIIFESVMVPFGFVDQRHLTRFKVGRVLVTEAVTSIYAQAMGSPPPSSVGPPPGTFFASSDEELNEDPMLVDDNGEAPGLTPMTSPRQSSRASSSPEEKLFLEDDEDEEMNIDTTKSLSDYAADDDIHIIEPPPAVEVEDPSPTLKRKFSSADAGPSRTSTQQQPTLITTPMYLGETIITNAWSNVSGKGYVKVNDPIDIRRDTEDDNPPPITSSKSKPTKTTSDKKGSSKKQTKLSFQQAAPTKVVKKKKRDTIVRLVNKKGFGMYPQIRYFHNGQSMPLCRIWSAPHGTLLVVVQTSGTR